MAEQAKKKTVKDIETIGVISAGFIVLYFVFKFNLFLYIALSLLVLGLASALFAKLLTKSWYKLAELLGFISSRILLSGVYFLILFPLAMLYRLFNKDPLLLKKNTDSSLYSERNHVYTAEELENPW